MSRFKMWWYYTLYIINDIRCLKLPNLNCFDSLIALISDNITKVTNNQGRLHMQIRDPD